MSDPVQRRRGEAPAGLLGLVQRLRTHALVEAWPDDENETRAAVPEVTFDELREIASLLWEAADAIEAALSLPSVVGAPQLRDNGKPNRPHEFSLDPETECCVICGWAEAAHNFSVESHPEALPSQAEALEVDVQLLAWAVSNCHMLARRRLNALDKLGDSQPLSFLNQEREFWQHVQRICEKAGAKSAGVLRASVPRDITDGAGETPVQPSGEPLDLEKLLVKMRAVIEAVRAVGSQGHWDTAHWTLRVPAREANALFDLAYDLDPQLVAAQKPGHGDLPATQEKP